MSEILPVKDDIKAYFWMVFGYLDGLIPLRSFQEKGGGTNKPPANIWIEANDDMAVNALNFAMTTNQRQTAFYVIPGAVAEHGQASSGDILQMQVLLIDIDDGDTESKLALLENALGKASMVVESGGMTSEGHTKLHVYWQLMEAASGEELKQLLELRHKIALAVGGDTSFKSAHQPIRVAGSVYYKGGVAKLVKIRSYSRIEYTLEELVEGVKKLIGVNTLDLQNFTKNLPNINNTSLPFNNILTSKVYEGGSGEASRFNRLSRIIGYWLRRLHDGLITEAQALEEIHSYNLANVVPSWSLERIKQEVNGLWKLHLKKYGEPRKILEAVNNAKAIKSFSLRAFLDDQSELPQDLIAPRILTPGGLFVFGGAPKVGKSDFLLSLFVHLAAGVEFLGFKPSKPLKIFYFQTEVDYHYLRERLQNMRLSKELIDKAQDNLYTTHSNKVLLDESGTNAVAEHIKEKLNIIPDIIAIDPLRNVFDGGRDGATENENQAMIFFLQNRIDVLRNKTNPNAGVILVHHTKKITHTQFEEDPFQAFSGASSLRGYYTTGALLYKPEPENDNKHLIFELRNGKNIPTKIINKTNGLWTEVNPLNIPVTNQHYSTRLNAERDRRDQLIMDILQEEAQKGRAYSVSAFCEAFDSERALGSRESIRSRIKVLTRKGYIKFFKNTMDYGFGKCTSNYGLMCFENMQLVKKRGKIQNVFPTHYLHHEFEELYPVENSEIWKIYKEEIEYKEFTENQV
ncbi:AAA family ATPase [Rickettsia endosymbiont of Ceutorhynchus obstrictus]|uniref:AAA family ATPase n=1 Tax=Rickettsia endosymbiont of Ceutorhynchus obstrictus TaxID=3066249 RepID=UPI003132DE67